MNEYRQVPASLFIGAEMHGRKFVVEFDGAAVALPDVRYRTLISLVDCRLKRQTGLAFLADFDVAGSGTLLYQTIRRLREDIDAVYGAGVGKLLIETCGSCTYRLQIARGRIEIDPNLLLELSPVHLPTELVQQLIENAAAVRGAESRAAVVGD